MAPKRQDFPSRRFPYQCYIHKGVDTDKIEVNMPGYPFVFTACPDHKCAGCGWPSVHIFIAVDGACRDNGKALARSAYGLYFGWKSPWNENGIIKENRIQTSGRAELYAAIHALRDFRVILDKGDEDLCGGAEEDEDARVTIKSDSAYLVDGITRHIYKWRKNRFTSAKGVSVRNEDLWRQLDDLVDKLNDDGVCVWFWHVQRERNRAADAFARRALDGVLPEEVDVYEYFDDGRLEFKPHGG